MELEKAARAYVVRARPSSFCGSDDGSELAKSESVDPDDHDDGGDGAPNVSEHSDGVTSSHSHKSSAASQSPASTAATPSSDEDVHSFADSDQGKEEEVAIPELPFSYAGLRFSIQEHKSRTRPGEKYKMAKISCSFGHPGCARRRGRGHRQCSQFGDWEPLGFLLAWSRIPGARPWASRAHIHTDPKESDVRRAVRELKEHYRVAE